MLPPLTKHHLYKTQTRVSVAFSHRSLLLAFSLRLETDFLLFYHHHLNFFSARSSFLHKSVFVLRWMIFSTTVQSMRNRSIDLDQLSEEKPSKLVHNCVFTETIFAGYYASFPSLICKWGFSLPFAIFNNAVNMIWWSFSHRPGGNFGVSKANYDGCSHTQQHGFVYRGMMSSVQFRKGAFRYCRLWEIEPKFQSGKQLNSS